MTSKVVNIVVAGTYRISDGYPNVKWLLHGLEGDERFAITYAVSKNSTKSHFSDNVKSKWRLLVTATRLFIETLETAGYLFYLKFKGRKYDVIYIPYPAFPTLFVLSFLPVKNRPVVMADSFISIYDTLVNDRRILHRGGKLAKALFLFERRSLLTADVVLVDTECSKHFLQKLFSLHRRKVHALPLATDELNYFPYNAVTEEGLCKVLFIGTFVPLHGAEIVAKAALLLGDRKDIQFRFFGDGQTAESVKEILAKGKCNVMWEQCWTTPEQLAIEMQAADICLGIFGVTSKASRVWPLKNYSAMRVGRALITEYTECYPGYMEGTLLLPVRMIPPDDANALASEVAMLADNYEERHMLAKEAGKYYEKYLSNKKVLNELHYKITHSISGRAEK